MKPSLRIKEIFQSSEKNYLGNEDITYATYSIKAILDYLDEEWEKKQTAFQYREEKADHCCRCVTACGHSTPPSFCENHR